MIISTSSKWKIVAGIETLFCLLFRALLKSEIESAILGKQWILSCFGPFKDSECIPGLTDRSFEEIRLDFLESTKNQNIQQHVNELITQYNDSLAKLNHLKLATPDTIQLIANIYNKSLQEPKKSANTSTNVFALSNAPVAQPQPQQNPFQMGSVFGGTQQQAPTAMNAGSIFGGTATANPFQPAASANSIFGPPKEQTTSASNFTFSLGQQTPQTSIFGASHPPQTTQPNLMFVPSQPAQQLQQPPSVFGGSSTFGANNSMFATATQQPPGNSIFGSSMFTQSMQAAPSGVFGTVQPTPSQTTFAQPSTNVFGGFQQEILPSGNIFAQPTVAPPQNVFNMQQQPIPPAPQGSIFHIQQPSALGQQQAFDENPFQTKPQPIDENAYSKPEELTPKEIEAFQAEAFQIGQIPLKPPSRQLCF